jgi:deoxyribodipyrimidine photo-lyase
VGHRIGCTGIAWSLLDHAKTPWQGDRLETGLTGIDRFVAADGPWAKVLRNHTVPADAQCVLLWVQRAQRATDNRAANLAVGIGNALELPVVALFVLAPDYPDASARAYQFMADGLAELPRAFAARGIAQTLRVGHPPSIVPGVASELGAAVVVTDLDPLRLARGWKAVVAESLAVPFVEVATDSLVPPSAFPTLEYAARTIRPKLWRKVASEPNLLDAIPTTRARVPLLTVDPGPDPIAVVRTLGVRDSAGASDLRGGAWAAREQLKTFISDRLARYPDVRNQPDSGQTSRLSAYLHFGQISPLAVARAAIEARAGDGVWEAPKGKATIGEGHAVVDEPLQTFLDEAVTQRELAINYCLREPAYDAWEGLPDWGQRTLLEHLEDPRPAIYTPEHLEAGETGDALWNAAQRQMVDQGYMPNRLRMYWAKQLLLWTAHPEEALEIAIDLNDRYQLDGRDANGYANIAWAIGGRHDRPFPPRKPVLGLIRPMSARGMARTFDTTAYIQAVEAAIGTGVPGERPHR